jgi:hypothetical protein
MVKRKFEFGLSNGFCTMGGTISGEKKELLCQVTRNMGKLPYYCDKCHILRQCHKIIVTHNKNMNNNKIVCQHCGKNNFKCSRGLTQHLRNAAYCSQAEKEKKDKDSLKSPCFKGASSEQSRLRIRMRLTPSTQSKCMNCKYLHGG